MKRIYKIASYVIATLGFLFVSTSCSKDKVVATKIEMSEKANNEFKIGEFNYSDYEIIVTYSDNTTKTVVLDETMISNQDYLKTFSEGISTIKISYANISLDYEINVKRFEYDEDIYFPTGVDVTYDGNYHTIEVEGNIPDGTRIIYPNGNSFKNAARYPVSATLVNDLYVTKTITGEFIIKKSVYDVSKLEFKDRVFTYDGTEKMIEVKNAPKDLNITYSIGQASTNKAILAGEYIVTAHIDAGVNYEEVDDLTAKMTINKGTYDMTNYKFSNKTVVYTGEVQNIFITNENLLPTGVNVVYENNGNINAGTYEVTAKFISDNINYEPIEDKKATLTIKKASYTLTGVYLDSDSVAYDGKPHYLYYSGTLPQGVSFEGYVDNGQVNAGVYTVQAKFTYRDANNYEPITPVTGTLEITKSDLTSITFANKTVEYSGLNYKLTCDNVPAGVTVNYAIKDRTETSVKEPGEYVFTASFVYDEVAANNYNPLADMEATLYIKKKTLQTGFTSKTVEYDGEAHTLECDLTAAEEEFITVSYWIYNAKHEYIPFVSATEPGSYLIYAEFDIEDEVKQDEFYAHYEELYSQCETLIIDKVRYTPKFTNQVIKYVNGVPQTITFDTNELAAHPQLAFDDIVYTNNVQTDKGIYRATAKFYLTENAKKYYYDIAEQEVIYVIVTDPNTPEQNISPTFDNSTVVYDGKVHSVYVSGVPEYIEVELQNNSQVLPGTHTVTAIFTYIDPVVKHYYNLPKGQGTYYEIAGEDDKVYCTVAFTIEKKLYNVKYTNKDRFAYDGSNKVIEVDPSESFVTATFEYAEEERIIPGTYTVTCIPRIIDSTFNQIYRVEESTVQFEIVKADVMFSYTGLTIYYDGNEHYIKVIGLPEGINAITSGDGKIKPGVYPVEISFEKDPKVASSAYYNDIETQLETLTILNNPVSPGAFINYLNDGETKFVNQFTSLRDYINSWVDIKAFRVDWSVNYFKGPSDEYPIADTVRHGSSKSATDFVFSESTVGDDFVMVSIKLTLKEGYEIVDGSMKNTFSTLVQMHVGQTTVIDISDFYSQYGESGEVNQGESFVGLLQDKIGDLTNVTYKFTADYYIGNEIYSEALGNIHGDSTTDEDYAFSVATWGNRTCNVTYTLEVPKGYSLYTGTRSYQKLEMTTKLAVNPTSEVDIFYLDNMTNANFEIVQYTKFSENITNLVDFNHLDVIWTIDDGSNQVINNTTDYIIKNATNITCSITVKTKDNFVFRNSTDTVFTKTFNCKVLTRPAVNFTNFINAMDYKDTTIIQHFDYFKDIVNDVRIPKNTYCDIMIYDVDNHAYIYHEVEDIKSLDGFTIDNYVEGKKFKVVFSFYPKNDYLIVDENSYATNSRKFIYEYDIQEAISLDSLIEELKEVKNTYANKTIKQFTDIQDMYGEVFAKIENYNGVTCQYTIYLQNVSSGRVVYFGTLTDSSESHIFSEAKDDEDGCGLCAYIYIDVRIDRNSGYIFNNSEQDDYYYAKSMYQTNIEPVIVVNDVVTRVTEKTYNAKSFNQLFDLIGNNTFSGYADIDTVKISDSNGNFDNSVFYWHNDEYISPFSYTFLEGGNYKVYLKYNTLDGVYYVNLGKGETSFDFTIDIEVTYRAGIYKNTNMYRTINTYEQFTKITDVVNLYATSPDSQTSEEFLSYLFTNYNDSSDTSFTEHMIPTSFLVGFMNAKGNLIERIDGYMDSTDCLGFECDHVILDVTYSFDEDNYVFVNSYGDLYNTGTTNTGSFKIKINYQTKIDTNDNTNFWNRDRSDRYLTAGDEIRKYIYYGMEAYRSVIDITYCDIDKVHKEYNVLEVVYGLHVANGETVDNNWNYYLREVIISCNDGYYFSVDRYGKPIRDYYITRKWGDSKIPIDINNINFYNFAEKWIGGRVYNFEENSRLNYSYTVVNTYKLYSDSEHYYQYNMTTGSNQNAVFIDAGNYTPRYEEFEIYITITVKDSRYYTLYFYDNNYPVSRCEHCIKTSFLNY